MKRLLFFILLLLCVANPAHATTKSKWMASFQNVLNTTTVRYGNPMSDTGTALLAETSAFGIMPTGGTVLNMYVAVSAAAGASSSWQITFRQELAATTITCTISGASATTCNDTTHSVVVSAGDRLAVEVCPANAASCQAGSAPAAANISWFIEFQPTVAAETVWMGSSNNIQLTTNIANQQYLGPGAVTPNATETNVYVAIPGSFTIKKIYVRLASAPGAGNVRGLSVSVNLGTSGTPVAQCSNTTTCNDTSTTVAVVAGDKVAINAWLTGSGVVASIVSWGIVLVANTDGDFVLPSHSAPNTTAVRFATISGAGQNATEANAQTTLQADFTIKDCYVVISVAPGGGKTYTFQLNDNTAAASGYNSIAITGSGLTGNTTGMSFTPTAGHNYDTSITPSGTPSSTQAAVGYLAHIATGTFTPQANTLKKRQRMMGTTR